MQTGGATAGTDSDELVLENNSAGGLTILSGTAANGSKLLLEIAEMLTLECNYI